MKLGKKNIKPFVGNRISWKYLSTNITQLVLVNYQLIVTQLYEPIYQIININFKQLFVFWRLWAIKNDKN